MTKKGALYVLLLALTMMAAGCHLKKFNADRAENKEKREVRMAEYAARAEAEEEAKEEHLANIKAKAEAEVKADREAAAVAEAAPSDIQLLNRDSLLFQFQRRPCFGRCKVYKIKVYESGYSTYEGVNFVDMIGYYSTRLDAKEVAQVYTMIAEADFFSLEDNYDDKNIMDLPSIIFRARAMGQDKRITARYNVPESLTELAKKVDSLFSDRIYIAVYD